MQKKRFQVSLEIIHCDGFVSMPATAQALYIQILSLCDDEGFTSQIGMCKFLSHATDEDVQMLVDKEFIYLVGERKVCVVKHWKMNSWLRTVDKSTFEERSLIYINKNGNYTLDKCNGTPLDKAVSSDSDVVEQQYNSSNATVEQQENSPRVQTPARRPKPNHTNTYHNNPLHTNTYQSNPKEVVDNYKIEDPDERF